MFFKPFFDVINVFPNSSGELPSGSAHILELTLNNVCDVCVGTGIQLCGLKLLFPFGLALAGPT